MGEFKKKKNFFIYSLFEKKTKDMNVLSKECLLKKPILFATEKKTNSVVSITHEKKENKREYKCVVCKHDIILREGKVYRKHFAHKTKNGGGGKGGGGPETAEHKYTKCAIVKCLNKGGSFVVRYQCAYSNCAGHELVLNTQTNVDRAEFEYKIYVDGVKDKYRADVMVFMKDGTQVPIEVHVTHAVDDTNGKLSYFNQNYPRWFETDAVTEYKAQIYDVKNQTLKELDTLTYKAENINEAHEHPDCTALRKDEEEKRKRLKNERREDRKRHIEVLINSDPALKYYVDKWVDEPEIIRHISGICFIRERYNNDEFPTVRVKQKSAVVTSRIHKILHGRCLVCFKHVPKKGHRMCYVCFLKSKKNGCENCGIFSPKQPCNCMGYREQTICEYISAKKEEEEKQLRKQQAEMRKRFELQELQRKEEEELIERERLKKEERLNKIREVELEKKRKIKEEEIKQLQAKQRAHSQRMEACAAENRRLQVIATQVYILNGYKKKKLKN